jgi:diguanylate cyclase (GGDEF)-like protein
VEGQSDSDLRSVRNGRLRLATGSASQIAAQLSNLQLRESLREQSIRDPLTHLFNRRFLEESLKLALNRATRSMQPLSVILIDIDHFKWFNDSFGHAAGDQVLQSLARLLQMSFRASDICCRYGGEEFVIIVADSALQDTIERANTLCRQVEGFNLDYDGQRLGSITVSAGVATFPEHGNSFEALLRTADRCLYESKRKGRNVVTAPAL